MKYDYNEIRQLVNNYLLYLLKKNKGTAISFSVTKLCKFLGKRFTPTERSIILHYVYEQFKNAIYFIDVTKHKKLILFDRKKLEEILNKEMKEPLLCQ